MTAPFPRELIAWHESLTSPDAQDWQIVVDGKMAHLAVTKEVRTPLDQVIVHHALFEIPINDLRRYIREYDPNNLRPGQRRLGLISMHVCDDGFDKAIGLARWLASMGSKKNFNVVSVIETGTTARSIEILRNSMKWVPPGFSKLDDLPAGRA